MPNRTRQLLFNSTLDPRKTPNIMDLGMFPPFSGAVEWLKSHKEEIRTFTKLLYTYPYLIQEECMDEFWNFLQSLNYGKDQHDSLDHDFEWDELDIPASPSENCIKESNKQFPQTLFVAGRTVYLCFPQSETADLGFLTKMDAITQAIVPFCFVRSNISFFYPSIGIGAETLQSISDANIFLFYLCASSLESKKNLDLLCHAVANNIPVIMLREPGYKLPIMFPEHLKNIEITRRGHHIHSVSDMHLSDVSSLYGDVDVSVPSKSRTSPVAPPMVTLTVPRVPSPAVSISSIPSVRTYFAPSRDPSDEKINLSDILIDGFNQSVTYVEDFHDTCIKKLYNKLSEHLGNLFPESGTACRIKRSQIDHHKFIQGLLHSRKDSLEIMNDDVKGSTMNTKSSTKSRPVYIKRTNSNGKEIDRPSLQKIKSHGSWEGPKLPPIPRKVSDNNSHIVPIQRERTLSGKTRQLSRQANVKSVTSPPIAKKSQKTTNIIGVSYDCESLQEKSTSYLLFPDTSKRSEKTQPELVRWPLTKERKPDFLPFSDSPITFDDCSFDVDWNLLKYETPSPEIPN